MGNASAVEGLPFGLDGRLALLLLPLFVTPRPGRGPMAASAGFVWEFAVATKYRAEVPRQ
jgi:hypothetical protein